MTDNDKLLSYLKRVTADLHRTRQRLADVEGEPIAIVGMACRYPGGVDSPEALWRLVADGIDAVGEAPAPRGWQTGQLAAQPLGGFLRDAGMFDPGFFGISPREALVTDPQQRLMLEVCWEAVERAGIDPNTLGGTEVGVFAGSGFQDYDDLLAGVPDLAEAYLGSASLGSMISGRVAYVLGLEGPAVTVDTACSSSLVALHLAVQSLRSGECDLALAGGVTVMSTVTPFVAFDRQGGLALDGRCKSFADAADGVAWGEGVGVLVVERLSDALRRGHRVLAVVRGSAVNQDGASNGLTAPNGPAQQRVIRAALANAQLSADQVDAVEGHGTGTVLGDPIEAQALLATYGQDRDRPLWLGSLKSNIGHAQAAAGVGGVIKMVMAMQHGVLPKTLHVDAPSSKVDWSASAVELLTEAREWDADGPRRAGVSSFGISGTNAHVILEQAPGPAVPEVVESESTEPVSASSVAGGMTVWVLSARTAEALAGQADRLVPCAADADATDVGHSLVTTRSVFEHRAVVIGGDRDELLAGTQALSQGEPSETVVTGYADDGSTGFVFSGQGGQWAGMAQRLCAEFPVFAERFNAAVELMDPLLGQDMGLAAALADPDVVDQTVFAQSGLFAYQVALAELLRSWGVVPEVVTGHSAGEIAAACVAGLFSLPDACRLIATRARLMHGLPAGGAMAAVGASEDEVTPLLSGLVSVAVVNGPTSVVVSGPEAEVSAVVAQSVERGWRTSWLRVPNGAHSVLIDPMLDEFASVIADVVFEQPSVTIVSTLTGARVDGEMSDPAYWLSQVRNTVRFADAVTAMHGLGVSRFAEIGPDAVLTPMIIQNLDGLDTAGVETAGTVVPVVHRDHADARALMTGLAALFVSGADVDWIGLYRNTAARTIDLPTYPFQHEHFWITPEMGTAAFDANSAGLDTVRHPLLRVELSQADSDAVTFTGRLSTQTHPWLAEHQVLDTVLFPGAGFVELALYAGDLAGCPTLHELTVQVPLVISPDTGVHVQVSVGATQTGGDRVLSISSRPDEPGSAWTRHAEGRVGPDSAEPGFDFAVWPPAGAEELSPVADCYDQYAKGGLVYGPAFQGLRSVWRSGEDVFADVAMDADAGDYAIHPALLDACMHASSYLDGGDEELEVPFAWSGVRLHAVGASRVRVRLRRNGNSVTMAAADETGRPVATVDSMTLRPISPEHMTAGPALGDSMFELSWVPVDPRLADNHPEIVVVHGVPGTDGDAIHAEVHRVLEIVREFLAADSKSVLVLHTDGAVAMPGEDVTDLAGAATWGLVRSAQSEYPNRIVLVDGDADLVPAAVATGEPQVAVRDGLLHGARLVRSAESDAAGSGFGPTGTVLITGASGQLPQLLARHLVREHGVRRLLLASRRGAQAPGSAELRAELEELGATAEFAACDVSDRDSLATLLAGVPAEHRLTGIVHMAGVLDDGTIGLLTAQQVDAVLRPKVDAALHLHELTLDEPLDAFVVFGSTASTFGNPGQGNYAAANACLDALIAHRRANGRSGQSLSWGLWDLKTGMVGELDQATRARLRRAGVRSLTAEEGLRLFDAACARNPASQVLVPLDLAALRQLEQVPALMRALVRPARRRVVTASNALDALRQRLAGLAEEQRLTELLGVVRGQVAGTLGHAGPDSVPAKRAFNEMGFDSLTALEFRRSLGELVGLRLPATLVFDYPNALETARFVLGEIMGSPVGAPMITSTAAAVDDPIAIVGMACRYPGGVASPDDLWDLVAGGVDVIDELPTDRGWEIDALYDPEPGIEGRTYTRHGGFLYNAAEFDADFFGISPNDALSMDPQQRVLLETTWEAIENAGIDPMSLAGSATGVFAGVMYHDYGQGSWIGGSTSGGLVSGRISYSLGLVGPALSVDTACSSSLVALHTAVQALRSGDCDLALVGGVTVMATPETLVGFSGQRGLSVDGRCKSFAEAADGTGWGEGSGMLVIERLSDARRRGHRVLAIVSGSAVNQDGASNGFFAPNGPSQQRVILQALADAGLSAADVDAVEAHGTGTVLGDPIEAQALLATYGQDRDRPLWLGSLKSNIGHAQAAAGVGGVIKMVMAMRHGVLPKTLHVDAPSSKVDWSAGAVELLTEAREWETDGRPRRVGVSSFGISGTNAHVILEQAPDVPVDSAQPDRQDALVAWVLSARSAAALTEQANRLVPYAADAEAVDVGYSLAATRSVIEHRAVVIGGDRDELLAGTQALSRGESNATVVTGRAGTGSTGFVFSGQGAQWAGMAQQLCAEFPVFAERFDAVVGLLDPLLGQDTGLAAALTDPDVVDRTVFAQAGLFAFEVALVELLRSWGVVPEVVAGHSIGEVTAAHVAGVLSLSDACRLVAARARLMQALPAGGAMAAVGASEDEVTPLLSGAVSVAAVNSLSSVVVSGPEAEVAAVVAECVERGWRTNQLRVSHGFHSVLMEPMLDEFAAVTAGLEFHQPTVAVVSTVTGEQVDGQMSDPSYWVNQVRDTVRFADAVTTMHSLGVARFAEIGPDAVLAPMVGQTLPGIDMVPLARRDNADASTVLTGVARLWVTGADADWSGFYRNAAARTIDLPTYPFEHRRYWLRERVFGGEPRLLGLDESPHPMVAAVVPLPGSGGVVVSGRLSSAAYPWLADHRVMGTVVFPSAGLVELAVHAGNEIGCGTVVELSVQEPLVVSEDAVDLQAVVGAADDEGRRPVDIYSRDRSVSPVWRHHAQGTLAPTAVVPVAGEVRWPPVGAEELPVDDVYERLSAGGLEHGAAFRNVRAVWRRGAEVFAEVSLPEEIAPAGFGIHPALLDACTHISSFLGNDARSVLPFAWSGVTVHAGGATRVRVRLSGDASGVEAVVTDELGRAVVSVDSLVLRPASTDELELAPIALDVVALRTRRESLPAPISADNGATATNTAHTLRARLTELTAEERAEELLKSVRSVVAEILGHPGPQSVEPDRTFNDLGFDSLTAVEFRNTLSAALGLELPATLIYDYPDIEGLAAYLGDEFNGGIDGRTNGSSDPAEYDTEAGSGSLIDELDVASLINMAYDGAVGADSVLSDPTQER